MVCGTKIEVEDIQTEQVIHYVNHSLRDALFFSVSIQYNVGPKLNRQLRSKELLKINRVLFVNMFLFDYETIQMFYFLNLWDLMRY